MGLLLQAPECAGSAWERLQLSAVSTQQTVIWNKWDTCPGSERSEPPRCAGTVAVEFEAPLFRKNRFGGNTEWLINICKYRKQNRSRLLRQVQATDNVKGALAAPPTT